ncbi:PREDICTED: uncharacterized protein LOC107171404 [Diuraphis noxia]|uniref:uncharacterized protein LOC107171404 n=1 Tax=Diuraphis noxia TaxID=143948 RepID=UPI0007639DDF|nr:PREDICTED: uncharacterized protein LOC107171404 [Diuraphis noxia]
MKKVTEQFPKQKTNIRKNSMIMPKVQLKTNTNLLKNENIPNKCVSDMDEAILRWDKLKSKIKVPGDGQEVINAESKINNHNNAMKSDLNNKGVKNVNLSNTNVFEPFRTEMENMYNYVEQLNEKLKTVTAKLTNEKSNIVLINSVTAALALDNLTHQNLQLEQKILEGFSYKEKLDSTSMELANVIIEKTDLQRRLKDSEAALVSASEKIHALSEKSDDSKYAEQIKEIEDERLEWNVYQIQLENQIAEDHKALSRKEQYIKHQDYIIENLTQDKLNLEIQLNKPLLELQSHQSEEIENYQNEIKRLSTIITDTKKTLVANKESHMTEMSEMRDRIRELEKLVDTKTDLIHQQNMTINLMREITPATNDNSIMKHRCHVNSNLVKPKAIPTIQVADQMAEHLTTVIVEAARACSKPTQHNTVNIGVLLQHILS